MREAEFASRSKTLHSIVERRYRKAAGEGSFCHADYLMSPHPGAASRLGSRLALALALRGTGVYKPRFQRDVRPVRAAEAPPESF
jgi:hypothetical protein